MNFPVTSLCSVAEGKGNGKSHALGIKALTDSRFFVAAASQDAMMRDRLKIYLYLEYLNEQDRISQDVGGASGASFARRESLLKVCYVVTIRMMFNAPHPPTFDTCDMARRILHDSEIRLLSR